MSGTKLLLPLYVLVAQTGTTLIHSTNSFTVFLSPTSFLCTGSTPSTGRLSSWSAHLVKGIIAFFSLTTAYLKWCTSTTNKLLTF